MEQDGIFNVIIVITTLVVGLGLLAPLGGMVLAAQPDWNCDADSFSNLVCVISDFWIIFFTLALFLFIGTILYKKRQQQNPYEQAYSYPMDYG